MELEVWRCKAEKGHGFATVEDTIGIIKMALTELVEAMAKEKLLGLRMKHLHTRLWIRMSIIEHLKME